MGGRESTKGELLKQSTRKKKRDICIEVDILFVILAILTYSASYYIYIWKEVGGGSLENNFLQQWSEKKKTIGIKENM